MDVTLRQLNVFVAIADHRGFGAAAAALGMSQSSVSHSLASLERAVRGELVRRAAPAGPTPLGDALLPHARATLAAARAFAAAAAARHDAAAEGTITVAVPPTAAHGLLPRLLRLWRENAPHVEIRIFEGFAEEITQWLESGTVDAAILIDPDPVPRGAVPVATDALEAVMRGDHPLAGEDSIELADLLDDPLLATTSGAESQLRNSTRWPGFRTVPRSASVNSARFSAWSRPASASRSSPRWPGACCRAVSPSSPYCRGWNGGCSSPARPHAPGTRT